MNFALKHFLPSTQDILDMLHRVLPRVTVKRNDDLLELIHSSILKLTMGKKNALESVENFVDHVTFLAHCLTQHGRTQLEYSTVNQ